MTFQKLTTFLFVIFTYHSVAAQILKIDKGSIASDSSGYFMGTMILDFNLNNKSATADQNVTYTGIDANADLVYVGNQHAYILINQLNYFKTTTGPLFSTGQAHMRINFLRKRKVSYELFSQVQYDQGRNMPLRWLNGGNIRFRFRETANTKFHVGIGLMYERENWNSFNAENVLIEKHMVKSTNYINYKQRLNENVHFSLSFYYQVGFDQQQNIVRNRISSQTILKMKLTNRLAFITSFTAQYEDRPIIPINNWVYALTNGFKFSF